VTDVSHILFLLWFLRFERFKIIPKTFVNVFLNFKYVGMKYNSKYQFNDLASFRHTASLILLSITHSK